MDFFNGVNFKVGKSKEEVDFNYIYWSFFGGKVNYVWLEFVFENVNNWIVEFDFVCY